MTDCETIYDYAMVTIKDYRIDKLANADYASFLTYMRGFLVHGIASFQTNCFQTLELTTQVVDSSTKYSFTVDLTLQESMLLADEIVYYWVQSLIQETEVFQPKMSAKSFKYVELPSAIKQRSEYLDKLEGKINNSICSYQFNNLSSIPFLKDIGG